MPSPPESSGFSKSFAMVNDSAPSVVIANLGASAPPGIDQVRLSAPVSASMAVKVATAVAPSATVNAAAEVTDGAGPGTVAVIVVVSRRPSELHTAPDMLQARPAGRVMTTGPPPSGRTSTSQPMLLDRTRRRAFNTVPPLVSNSARLKSR